VKFIWSIRFDMRVYSSRNGLGRPRARARENKKEKREAWRGCPFTFSFYFSHFASRSRVCVCVSPMCESEWMMRVEGERGARLGLGLDPPPSPLKKKPHLTQATKNT
jgi:hypothetical protein